MCVYAHAHVSKTKGQQMWSKLNMRLCDLLEWTFCALSYNCINSNQCPNESEHLFIALQWSESTLLLWRESQKLDVQIQRASSNHVFIHPLNYCLLAYISNTLLDNDNHSMPHWFGINSYIHFKPHSIHVMCSGIALSFSFRYYPAETSNVEANKKCTLRYPAVKTIGHTTNRKARKKNLVLLPTLNLKFISV